NTSSDVKDSARHPVTSSVNSVPVFIGPPYGLWARSRGLVAGVNAGPNDDPDNDHRYNLEEFAVDANPLSGGGDDKRRIAIQTDGAVRYLTYTFPVRDGAIFS